MEDSNRLLKAPKTKTSTQSKPTNLSTTPQTTSIPISQQQQSQSPQSFTETPSGSSSVSESYPLRFQNQTYITSDSASRSTSAGASPIEPSVDLHDDTDQLIVLPEIKEKPTTKDKDSPSSSKADPNKKSADKKNGNSTEKGAPSKPDLVAIPETNFAIGLLVTCCFNPPLGLLAVYFSLRAAAAYRDGDKSRGATRARTSIVLSLLGIMLTMVIVSSVVVYIAENKHSSRGSRRPNSSALGF